MGRWAQRTRAGGGITAANFMTKASIQGPVHIVVDYYRPVDADALIPVAFTSLPSATHADDTINVFPNQISLFFPDPIIGDTDLEYTDGTPGIRTPQTIPLT